MSSIKQKKKDECRRNRFITKSFVRGRNKLFLRGIYQLFCLSVSIFYSSCMSTNIDRIIKTTERKHKKRIYKIKHYIVQISSMKY